MLHRSVRKIYPFDKENENEQTITFLDILDIPNIVLLGEPGAGKTYLFQKTSQYEKGKYIPARTFTLYADETYTNNPVYIDALDEKRSRTEQLSIDDIVRYIIQIKPSKVRLSCRTSDWLGETDLELFKPYFESSGGYCVVALEPLSEKEIDHILSSKHIDDSRKFREKAYEKGIYNLLTNPQTLTMLADLVIKNRQWPSTKKELYENATNLLLTEHNEKHHFKKLARFNLSRLKDAAGAACAALLIADAEGISLFKSNENSFAEVPYSDSDTVLAALTTRAFVLLDQQKQLAIYSHRTIAEYLGACWLVKSIRNGLPVSRVISWISIEDYPAPELRGLYAWLVQLLPEHADALLQKDPYGVLVLGDVGCLSLPNRKSLIKALVKLAEKDPWFRAQDWTSQPLGVLSTPDLANDLKDILSKQPQQFHLRSVILDAICFGKPQPELKDELLQIFCDESLYYSERYRAFKGLIQAIPNGKELVIKATKEHLKTNNDDLRLKEEVIACIYEDNFNIDDVVQLINDYINHSKLQNQLTDGLWVLGHSLPMHVLPELLDRLTEIDPNQYKEISQIWSFNYEILKRTLLNASNNLDVNRLWLWFSKLKFSPSSGFHRKDAIKDWLGENQQNVIAFFNIALQKQNDLTNIWRFWSNFQNSVQNTCDINQIISSAFSFISDKDICNEKDQFIFELAIYLTAWNTVNLKLFNKLFDYGCSHPELTDVLLRTCQSEIPDWRWDQINQAIDIKEKGSSTQHKIKNDFEKLKDLIHQGREISWLGRLAQIYFARGSDNSCNLFPKERLEQHLGIQNAEIALEGLQAVLTRNDLPTPATIANSYNQHPLWWLSVLAGMTECWSKQSDLSTYPKATLKTALALNLMFPSFYQHNGNYQYQIEPDWQQALFHQKPELVQQVYLEVIEILLKSKRDYVHGLRDICDNPQLSKNRAPIILRLLIKYLNSKPEALETLLLRAITLSEIKQELLLQAQFILKPRTRIRLKQKMLWLCAGFFLDFDQFKDTVTQCANKHEDFIWTLIWIIDRARIDEEKAQPYKLSENQCDFIIRLIGSKFADIEHPSGIMHGNRNPWDAADFVKNLHALTIEYLKDVREKIRTANTDIYKSFWNEDSNGKITGPKPEETCRDRLIDLLRPKFEPLEIHVEPEGHMAIDKRADIVLLNVAKQKLPIEIKRDYHTAVWTGCRNQLDRLYTRDPGAQGYGIYLVFWFGEKRGHSMPTPPVPLPKPNAPFELENALRSLINADDRYRLEVFVIDVTRPDD